MVAGTKEPATKHTQRIGVSHTPLGFLWCIRSVVRDDAGMGDRQDLGGVRRASGNTIKGTGLNGPVLYLRLLILA